MYEIVDIMWLHKINCHFAQLLPVFSGKQSAALN